MDEKQKALEYIKNLAAQKLLTREELLGAFEQAAGSPRDHIFKVRLSMTEILYYIGGAIVCLGIAVLLWQNWSTLNVVTKITATLGSGLAAYIVGLVLGRDGKNEALSSAFYLISALVMPLGLHVTFQSAGFNIAGNSIQSLVSAILLATYLASYFVLKRSVFIVFSIIFGTWFFFAFTNLLAGYSAFTDNTFSLYRVLTTGVSYILLGHSFSKTEKASLSGFLYGFGIFGFLGAALLLGGFGSNHNVFWEVIYLGLVFGTLFLSTTLKSNSFLVFGTLYLMAYILKITAEYFSKGLGWPFALVLAGLMLMGAGYLSVYLKRRYIPKK